MSCIKNYWFTTFHFDLQLMTEKNLENVSHEDAVSALKCTSDRVVLVVAKTDGPLAPMQAVGQPPLLQQQTPLLSQSAVNLTTHHSHQPPSPNPGLGKLFVVESTCLRVFRILIMTDIFCSAS
jgi:hypothetical protein